MNNSSRLRVLVVDDEKLARDFLIRMLSRKEGILEIQACATAGEARERIRQFRPDILFLDVEMPQMSGFQLLETLPLERTPVVIFTTAYAQFATKAFDIQACDYVLKPFDEERLSLALDRAREAVSNGVRTARAPIRISVAIGDRALRLSADEIDCLSAEDNYVRIHRGQENMLVRSTLGKLQRNFRCESLVRVHRSWIVNIKRVKEVKRGGNYQYILILENGATVTCGRRYKRQLRSIYNRDSLSGLG